MPTRAMPATTPPQITAKQGEPKVCRRVGHAGEELANAEVGEGAVPTLATTRVAPPTTPTPTPPKEMRAATPKAN